MGQSLAQVYIHIIFSTKYRKPMILHHFEKELHQFIADQCNQIGCIAIEVGGSVDHVHILCRLSKSIMIPALLQKIKGSSSKWIKTKYSILNDFYWQDGYGAFSVSPIDVDSVCEYIRNQHLHHLSQSYKEEYLGFLDLFEVEYDDQYLWDDEPSEDLRVTKP